MKRFIPAAALIFCVIYPGNAAFAWSDVTHVAIAKAAGYHYWFNAAGADMAREKAGSKEGRNHFANNPEKADVTKDTVLAQAARYDTTGDESGHLYGAIIGAVRHYGAGRDMKHAEHEMAFAAHYIGDLSNPLHNVPYDDFNKIHHRRNDGILEESYRKPYSDDSINDMAERLRERMYPIALSDTDFEGSLARETARIANIARMLGYRMMLENRDMTGEEARIQAGHSASLLRAVLRRFYDKGQDHP